MSVDSASPKRRAKDREAIAPGTFTPRAGTNTHERNSSPLLIILAALVPVMALCLWFLFTAKAVQIDVQATSDPQVDINGGLLISFGDRYFARPGDYQLTLSAPGYYSEEHKLRITKDALQQHRFTLKPLPGHLRIESTPPGASVLADGKTLGTTPLDLSPLDAGEHDFTLTLARYQSADIKVTIEGRDQRQNLAVDLKPDWATVTISSEPDGASVFIDGTKRGETPVDLKVTSGERQLTLKKQGFADHRQRLQVIAGQAQTLATIALQPAAASLAINSTPSGANITVNGEFAGSAPTEIALEPEQKQVIQLSLPGYQTHQQTFKLGAGQKQEANITLTPELGEIALRITPSDAVVSVGGKRIGKGSQTLSLPATEHKLRISRRGYKTHTQNVTPRAGITQSIDIRLAKISAGKTANASAALLTTSLGQQLKRLDGGSFTMGAARREPGRRANEVVHPVTLKRSFYLQAKEVSNAQFKKFRPAHSSGSVSGKSLNGNNQPVVNVSWTDAALYCNWLSQREGLRPFYNQSHGKITGFNPKSTGYRLPTEAEWAFAARFNKGAMRRYSWDSNTLPPPKKQANYADTSAKGIAQQIIANYRDGAAVTSAVGSYAPNTLGLYDLDGNVAEWTHDVYRISFDGAGEKTDPLGPQQGVRHSIRGASWADALPSRLRLSYRHYGAKGRNDTGFRLARYAD